MEKPNPVLFSQTISQNHPVSLNRPKVSSFAVQLFNTFQYLFFPPEVNCYIIPPHILYQPKISSMHFKSNSFSLVLNQSNLVEFLVSLFPDGSLNDFFQCFIVILQMGLASGFNQHFILYPRASEIKGQIRFVTREEDIDESYF